MISTKKIKPLDVSPLKSLLQTLKRNGADRFYAKILAPNDNSKNQVYLGGDFGALNIVPHGEIETDASTTAGSVRNRAKATVDFYWLEDDGLERAPNAQLILYPKYPEVRMSGFLKGTRTTFNSLMTSRDEGRVLILGICKDKRILGHVCGSESPIAKELESSKDSLRSEGVFLDLFPLLNEQNDTKTVLLRELLRVHKLDWIKGQKLKADGTRIYYDASNGGGYTLEAELGVSPNGYAEPDFLGWEIKQYGVNDFTNYRAKSPVTLMTPEPHGGLYVQQGLKVFMERFGYPDQSGKLDRINFGGKYVIGGDFHHLTNLRITLEGFDTDSQKITDFEGSLYLHDDKDTIAASWSIKSMIEHWNRKHAKAAYVPSMTRNSPRSYKYGAKVLVCEGTDAIKLLNGFAEGVVYYDPGIKLENASSDRPKQKKRSQFRVGHPKLSTLYDSTETVDLLALYD